jgi:chromate transporter
MAAKEESTPIPGGEALAPRARVGLGELFGVFFLMGATSFGGGVVAYLHEHLVERKKWLDEDHFLAALEIGEIVPGLISTNVAVIVGSRLRGVFGSLVAVAGVTLPGASTVFVLGLLYARFKGNPEVDATLNGIGAAAVGLILAVALQIGYSELKRWQDVAILLLAFVLVGIVHISLVPVLVVLIPIAVQLNRPTQEELTASHAQQASYHAQLAEHHQQVAARQYAGEKAP